ncbi:MAG: hypothetical protein GX234_01945 [Clostridiales bacterium]|nr:hypothetical protein [Clostridiales bacterium]
MGDNRGKKRGLRLAHKLVLMFLVQVLVTLGISMFLMNESIGNISGEHVKEELAATAFTTYEILDNMAEGGLRVPGR